MAKDLVIYFVVSFFCVDSPAHNTPSAFSVFSPTLVWFFRKFMTSFAVSFTFVNCWWRVTTQRIMFLCCNPQMFWVATCSVVAYMVNDILHIIPWYFTKTMRIYKAVYHLCFTPKIKSPISSVFYFSTNPLPTPISAIINFRVNPVKFTTC